MPGDLERSRIRRAGVVLLCLKVALLPLVFDLASDQSIALPKTLASHALAYALAGCLVALVIRSGSSAYVPSLLHWPVLAFVGANVLAAVFAVDHYVALFGTHGRMLGLGTILDWVVLYAAVAIFIRTRGDVIAVLASLFTASVGVVAYAAVQALGLDPLSWTLSGDRVFSTIGQATTLAQYTSTLAVVAFGLALLATDLPPSGRGALLALAVALLWGAAATATRAPVIGLLAGGFVLIAVAWSTHAQRVGRRSIAIGAAAAAGAVVALLVLTPIGGRFAFIFQEANAAGGFSGLESSSAGRLALYRIGVAEFVERPLVGYGPDNFVFGVPQYRPDPAPFAVRQSAATSAHSWLVQTAATTGILGLTSLLATIAAAGTLAYRHRARPIVTVAAAGLTAFLGSGLTTIDDVGVGWLPWLAFGAIAGATAPNVAPPEKVGARGRARRRATPQTSEARRVAAVLALGTGVVAMVVGVAALDASRSAKAATDARLLGRTSQAIDLAQSATRRDPGRAEYWHVLGLAYIGAQRYQEAAVALERASSMSPYNAEYAGDVIQTLLLRGRSGDLASRAKAAQLSADLVRRDPNNPRAHRSRAVALQESGDSQGAVREIERALALDPGSTSEVLYVTAAQIFLAAGRAEDAVAVAGRGIATIGTSLPLTALRNELDRALAALGRPPAARPDPAACTSARWSASPSAPRPVGTRVFFQVEATGCPQSESQIAIGPAGGAMTYLSSGAWAATHEWDTSGLTPGTYIVRLYTRRAGWSGQYQAYYESEYLLSR